MRQWWDNSMLLQIETALDVDVIGLLTYLSMSQTYTANSYFCVFVTCFVILLMILIGWFISSSLYWELLTIKLFVLFLFLNFYVCFVVSFAMWVLFTIFNAIRASYLCKLHHLHLYFVTSLVRKYFFATNIIVNSYW